MTPTYADFLNSLYHYHGRLLAVTDGDTLRVELDLGLRTYRQVSLRVADVDAPEVYGPEASEAGQAARTHAGELLANVDTLYIATEKDHKSFDRYVATVFYTDPVTGAWVNFGQRMVDDGYAKVWTP